MSSYHRVILRIFSVFIISSIAILIYSNSLSVPFRFDDSGFIVQNANIQDIGNVRAIWEFLPTRFVDFYSRALNYHFGRLNVFGYHLVNLGIHLCAGILVWWLARLLFATAVMKEDRLKGSAEWIAFFTGVVFVVHPIQTESVTYIHQRSSCLAGFFYLLSLVLYIKSRVLEEFGNKGFKTKALYVISWVAALLGMFSKENVITLPLMLVLVEFCFFKTGKAMKYKPLLPFLILLPLIPIIMVSTKPITFLHIERLTADPISGLQYFLTQLRVKMTYLRLLLVPINQNLDYDYPLSLGIRELPVIGSFIFLGLLLFTAFKLFAKHRILAFGIFWFFLTLLPESSFFPQPDVICEHRLYLPSIGFCIFIISMVYYLFWKKSSLITLISLIIFTGWFSYLTYARNIIWNDEFNLWDDTVRKSPNKIRPRNARANAYLNKGNVNAAIKDLNKAVKIYKKIFSSANIYQRDSYFRLSKNYACSTSWQAAEAYNNLGFLYVILLHDTDKALYYFDEAVKANPNHVSALNNRGKLYSSQGRYDKAITDFSEAIRIRTDSDLVWLNRGLVYAQLKEYQKAIADFNKALEIKPDFKEALQNRESVEQRIYNAEIKPVDKVK